MAEATGGWRRGLYRGLKLLLKVAITAGAFYLLLGHRVSGSDGADIPIWRAITSQLGGIDLALFVPWIVAGALVKFVGIFSSMARWHLLLCGQGIRFRLWHIIGAFLIGRFLGTFLPGTLGLDGYKLYDAARFSGRVVEPAAATAVEKVMGFAGIFLCFLVALPFGAAVFGKAAPTVVAITVPVASLAIAALFALLFRPGLIISLLSLVPAFGRRRIEAFVRRASDAAAAYRGKASLLATAMLLSFSVHFCTAVLYVCTALAIGAAGVQFWPVVLASTVQIFATVISPFTVAGEGVREAVQALLLAKHIGATESVLSAALGFWAAEALTLVGAFFFWARRADYKPEVVITAMAGPDAAASATEPEPSLSRA